MRVIDTSIADVKIIEPAVYGDARGFFFESFNEKKFAELTGITDRFVQDNHSNSARGVLRGLHYQINQAQGKLVRVWRARCLTSWSICAAARPRLASMSPPRCRRKTKKCCGCLPALPTVFW